MADPASIRTNNPGAQWYGPTAKSFGATSAESLPGGNNAAVFPDAELGAAAQFALLSRNYAGMPLGAAIGKWSGGNSSPAYTNFLVKETGLSPDTVLSPELLASPQGMALAKAQAQWEAGKPYPLSDEGWRSAQARGLSGTPPPAPGGAAGASAGNSGGVASSALPGASAALPGAGQGLGMLASLFGGGNLFGSSDQDNLGALSQRAAELMQAHQPPEPMPMAPIRMAVPAAMRGRLAAAALGRV